MNIILFMIGVSLLMALGFLFAFLWAMKSGQNDDLHTPAMRILFDEKQNRSSLSINKSIKIKG